MNQREVEAYSVTGPSAAPTHTHTHTHTHTAREREREKGGRNKGKGAQYSMSQNLIPYPTFTEK